jgi:hypothetical protein
METERGPLFVGESGAFVEDGCSCITGFPLFEFCNSYFPL